jgi:RimJ/RimL family protein N-acetyltransferase
MVISARLLGKGDETVLDDFLEPYTPFVFFPRSNVRKGGIVYNGKDYQADYFVAFDGDIPLGVLTHSWLGSVQIFVRDEAAVVPLFEIWRARVTEKPRKITGFLGPARHVELLRDAAGIAETDLIFSTGRKEWLFTLDLEDATILHAYAGGGFVVRRAEQRDAMLLIGWRYDFIVEALGYPPSEAIRHQAEDEVNRRLQDNDLFILEVEGRPVSYCGIGGFLPDWRIVGPVWTPPELRSREYARRVISGGINMLRDEGVENIVLFAGNDAAISAYEAVGFRKIGDWRLDHLREPRTTI